MDNINQTDILLYNKVAELIELARKHVTTTVNLTQVHTYYEIGRMIVEDEQQGKERAGYGKGILKDLSKRLTERFGRGFSIDNLEKMRKFYLTYSISETLSRKFENLDSFINTISNKDKRRLNKNRNSSELLKKSENKENTILSMLSTKSPVFKLSWSHYLVLMRIENPMERNFYEIEAFNQNWSERQLKKQYQSSLFERLVLSRNKDEIIKLANVGQTVEKPADILKNPLTLDFLGMEQKTEYTETDLENAIISKIQHFLLELGKGFLFEARQKRFSFEEKSFFVDLVFYNRLLQCYVLIDLKTDELEHKDLGQMQMYINYYDRYVKLNYEKPSIGILLCKKKHDALVELTLPQDANIYASEYSLYLPDKQVLQQKMAEWILEFENAIK